MKEEKGKDGQLSEELKRLRKRVAELEQVETERLSAEQAGKQAEERIKHLNLVLRAIRHVNQLIVKERDRDRLLQGACDGLTETHGYHNAWIALLDESGGLVTTAEAGLDAEFLPLVEQLKRGELTDCERRALSQSEVVVIEDPPSTCTDCPLSDKCAGRGAMTVRLEHGSKVYGLLSVSIPTHLLADEEEQALFEEVAADIAFALHSIEVEGALLKERNFINTLVQASPTFFVAIGSDGKTIMMNDAMLDALSYSADEVKGRDYLSTFVPVKDHELLSEVFEKLTESHEKTLNENHILTKAGQELLVEWHGRPIFNENGEFEYFFGVGIDITERKKAEEELRKSEERYRSIVEHSHAGILIVDDAYQFIYVNDELCRILEYSREEIVGQGFRRFLDDESKQLVADRYVRRQRGEKVPPRYEFNVVRKDGEKRRVEISSTVIRDSAGKVKTVAQILDITERKRAEEERRQSSKKLQRALRGTVHALASAVEMRDPYTAGHQRRVTELACAIAKEAGLSEEQIEGLRMAGLIHDIGKINVPAEILSKPTRLTDNEFDLVKIHPRAGYDILKEIEFPWPVAQIVLQHHERMDGSGYPTGLKGDEILLEARILAVADVVEAMSSHRPYRPARGLEKALEEIAQNKGKLYDPKVVDVCLRLFAEGRFKFES